MGQSFEQIISSIEPCNQQSVTIISFCRREKDISTVYSHGCCGFFFFRGDNRYKYNTHTHTRREPVASVGSVSRDPPSSGMELCVSVKRQTKELRWSRRRRLHWLRWTKKTIGPGCEFWSLITADWSSRKFGSHDPLLQASYKYRLHYYYIVSERRLSVRFSATPPSLRFFFLFFYFSKGRGQQSWAPATC